jgi:dTDP-4-amino-4,6-dideoxygalactose transaminase
MFHGYDTRVVRGAGRTAEPSWSRLDELTTVTLANPNQFSDLSREDPDSPTCFQSVLSGGQLFRYVESDREASNTLVERHFADHFRKEAATAVVNGTVGLRLALRALGAGPGDRVLVSAYSVIACAMAIASARAVPVPMDEDVMSQASTYPSPEEAVALAPRILSVPTSKRVTESDIARVAKAVGDHRHHLVAEK